MNFRCAFLLLISVFAVAAPGAACAAGPEGLWLVEDQTGRIKIQKCGTQMWGVISWQKAMSGYMLPSLLGNIIGGATLVSALNHAQVIPRRGK